MMAAGRQAKYGPEPDPDFVPPIVEKDYMVCGEHCESTGGPCQRSVASTSFCFWHDPCSSYSLEKKLLIQEDRERLHVNCLCPRNVQNSHLKDTNEIFTEGTSEYMLPPLIQNFLKQDLNLFSKIQSGEDMDCDFLESAKKEVQTIKFLIFFYSFSSFSSFSSFFFLFFLFFFFFQFSSCSFFFLFFISLSLSLIFSYY
jgi:hypothetical protein